MATSSAALCERVRRPNSIVLAASVLNWNISWIVVPDTGQPSSDILLAAMPVGAAARTDLPWTRHQR